MDSGVDFTSLLIAMAVAVAVPIGLGLVPRVPVPSSVLEIVGGILVGPAVLGWVSFDEALNVVSSLGVGFLLFLAGLELDFVVLRGRRLQLGLRTFVSSLVIGLLVAFPLGLVDQVKDPGFVAIVVSATSVGIVVPVLRDAGRLESNFGRFVLASASIAEFGSIVVLSMRFSTSGSSAFAVVVKLVLLVVAVLVIAAGTARVNQWEKLGDVFFRLQDSSSQIRVRLAVLLLLALLVFAGDLGFDAILGAFLAGALVAAFASREREEEFGHFRHKLEGMGFGLFVPVFFVATGVQMPVDALLSSDAALVRVGIFFVLLLVARGVPALWLRHELSRREVVAAGLLQATSLSFVVVATQIGVQIGEVGKLTAASMVVAGMLSVLVFPAIAMVILDRSGSDAAPGPVGES